MKVGDVLALPSGSSRMTVKAVGETTVDVIWMGYGDHIIYEKTLPKEIFEQPKTKE
jgi:hypothetical protein